MEIFFKWFSPREIWAEITTTLQVYRTKTLIEIEILNMSKKVLEKQLKELE
jgi:hypothetical protein